MLFRSPAKCSPSALISTRASWRSMMCLRLLHRFVVMRIKAAAVIFDARTDWNDVTTGARLVYSDAYKFKTSDLGARQ